MSHIVESLVNEVLTVVLLVCYRILCGLACLYLGWQALRERWWLALLVVVFSASPALAQTPCSHYASPAGTGSSCSQSAPCQVQSFWAHAGPGKTLCLMDGMYTGEPSMILPPSQVSGSASQPLTIRALNDGKVTLNGNGYFAVLLGNNDGSGNQYITVEGLNAHTGGEALYRVRGSNNTLRRVIGWDGSSGQADSNIIRMTGKNNWCEDCAGWGKNSRKIMDMAQGNNVGGGGFLRGWAEWNDHPQGVSKPNNTWLVSYNTGNARFFNVLGTWAGMGDIGNAEGVMEIARACDGSATDAEGTLVKGALMYLQPGTTYQPGHIVTGFCASNFTLEDVAALVAPGFSQVRPFLFHHGGGASPAGSVCKNCLGVHAGAASSNSSNSGWSMPGFREGSTLQAATGGAPTMQLLPGLCRQYDRSGTLTQTPLWPWPMNQRIKDARQQSGYAPIDVTAHVEALLGPIPAACRSGGPPPPSDATPPTAQITAPSQGALVSGTVAVTAVVSDNVGVTSVRFLLDGEKVGEEHCCAPVTQVDVLADSLNTTNGLHTLQAVALDAAGNRTESAPIQVLVFNGVLPPPASTHPAMACTGELGAQGAIQMVCLPEGTRR